MNSALQFIADDGVDAHGHMGPTDRYDYFSMDPYRTLQNLTEPSSTVKQSKIGKSRRRRAYPQQIVTTRLLYCLQDPFAQLSRLQRI